MRVAVLQRDPVMRQSIESMLVRAGHFCAAYEDGRAMSRSLVHSTMDLLVLDWQDTRPAGADLLRSVRLVAGEHVPIMFVSNDRSEESMVRALAGGADEYLALPLRDAEFRARVAALLRRAYPVRFSAATCFEIGPYRFDTVRRAVTLRGEPVPLSPTQYRIAVLLFSNIDRVMSRDHIFATVWGREMREYTRTIDSHVSRLRLLLAIEPRNGFRLQPVYKSGYRLLRVGDHVLSG
ncbi:response regulator transcription factor [Paraburkholderia atlantica]|uniref:Two component transcriptional regulator, winged helix family n=1 Tax=Paraburkholderia atlantica TaxID=2654982 RepID=D5WIS8_PARAM|nr:response regulator transcription factor [Paraburkholderia atlantica]ADG18373.1 two component transcriptional regulator, winged helix family [Paraburkholderia atlantica]